MKETINYLDWQKSIPANDTVHALNHDYILLDQPVIPKKLYQRPFKIDVVVGVICIHGTIEGVANLHPYKIESSSLCVILPDTVLEFKYMSSDFEGRFIILSKKFLSNMTFDNSGEAFLLISKRPYVPLQQDELQGVLLYYKIATHIMHQKDNPYQIKTLALLTMTFFYGAGGYFISKLDKNSIKSKNDILFNRFMELIQTNFTQQKSIDFYAEKLNLSPKYLSTQIKQISGKTAGDWIDDRIMLEAKALLQSSNLTIQQISDQLNFPEQSAFGKFFKRNTGLSPKSYRLSR